MNRPTKPTDYSQLMVEILLWFVFAVVGSFVWMVNVRSKVPASWSIFHRCARVICLYHSMPTVSTITNTTVRVHTLCLKKNRTPITFWNNSNKLCLIIIMISWENRQKVLNIVVCYGLTIFQKTGYQLRVFPWWRCGLDYGRPLLEPAGMLTKVQQFQESAVFPFFAPI